MCKQTGRQTVKDNEFSIVAHQHIRYLISRYDSLHSYKTNYYDHFRGSLECINKYINCLRPSWICKTYTGYIVNEIVLIICRAVSYAYLLASRIPTYSIFFIKLSYSTLWWSRREISALTTARYTKMWLKFCVFPTQITFILSSPHINIFLF